MLTDADIDLILGDKTPRASVNRVFTAEGWVTGKRNAESVGAFEGRTGTKYRSRKGRTWTKPNGQRYYNNLGATVLAYKAKSA